MRHIGGFARKPNRQSDQSIKIALEKISFLVISEEVTKVGSHTPLLLPEIWVSVLLLAVFLAVYMDLDIARNI